ncbi:rhomboid family intramembrane serine protease [Cloacibacterium rupense]|uniref:Rhomboid family intramembrane serine protease n=1 Tax=Cloacibacterium rupense TaxID=517423 RepID=A0ABQ2NK53_9FLAO|nr:rhomboid family intramembrane serine protease [Cloacibacterium rupense]GGP01218.1 rhomboid family intramembrane serine protease [Cloacibacterium rupense]
MHPVLIAIIAITVIISLAGFQNISVFEKYKFNVSAIKYKKEYIRLLSAGFLHADYMHLFLNMYVLYSFSFGALYYFGVSGFMITYIGAIILGNLFSLYIYKNQGWYSAIGASGGVSGIVFASVAMNPVQSSIGIIFLPPEFSIPGFVFGLLYFSYSVYMMLNPKPHDNIGHAAHLGGAAFGLVYAVATEPEVAFSNIYFLGVMSLPLLYMAYQVFVKKRIG